MLKLLGEGVPPEEVVRRYTALDVAREVDLDGLMSTTIAWHERNERTGLVKVAEFSADNFHSRKIFQTINHPTSCCCT